MIRNGLRTRPRDSKLAAGGSAKPAIDAELVRTLAQLVSESDLAELEIEKGDLRIKLVRQNSAQAQAPIPSAMPYPVAGGVMAVPHGGSAAFATVAEPESVALEDHPGAVKSPMVGTVFRRPSPEAKAFVDVGNAVKAGDKILLVEAMKTFNEIVAPRSGTITAIFVEDGQPVEYGQPLLLVE